MSKKRLGSPENQGAGEHSEVDEIFAKAYKYLASLAKGVAEFAEDFSENLIGPILIPKKILERGLKEQSAVCGAINSLKSLGEELEAKGVVIRSSDYYMAIALKESHFNPLAVSNLGKEQSYKTVLDKKPEETAAEYKKRISIHAFGAFQLKTDAIAQVNMVFGTKYKLEDVFYIPKETDDSVDSQIEDVKLRKAMETNAKVAILYWHYCRDIAPAKGLGTYTTKVEFKNPIDQDKFAALVYNYGTARAGTLFKAVETYEAYKTNDPSKIKHPKTYKDFEKIVAQIMAEGSGIKPPKEQKKGSSPAYKVFFKTYFKRAQRAKLKTKAQYKIYRPDHPKNKKQRMNYNPKVVLAALDYSSVIHSIRKGFYFNETETVCVSKYEKK